MAQTLTKNIEWLSKNIDKFRQACNMNSIERIETQLKSIEQHRACIEQVLESMNNTSNSTEKQYTSIEKF